MIRFENVSKIYKIQDLEIHALKHIRLEIRKGMTTGIIGQSQSGKTTLLRLMSGQEMPTEGKIWWENAREKTEVAYHTFVKNKKVAMLSQDYPLLWSKTVEQNISFLLEISGMQKQAIRRKMKMLLKKVRLDNLEQKYLPELNGLQRQQLALACVLIQEPEVVLCDETRFRLDPMLRAALFDLIEDLQKQYQWTVVYFTYTKEMIEKYCTEVVVLQKGEVIVTGKTVQVFRKAHHL